MAVSRYLRGRPAKAWSTLIESKLCCSKWRVTIVILCPPGEAMLNTSTYLPKLKEFEGSIRFMYVDSTGNVTVGVGNLLATAAAAQNLTFQRRPDPTAIPPITVARP